MISGWTCTRGVQEEILGVGQRYYLRKGSIDESLEYTQPRFLSSHWLSPLTEAALASPNSHNPPILETSSSLPISCSSAELKLSSKRSLRPWLSTPQLISFLFLLLVLLVQIFLPSPVHIGSIIREPVSHGVSVDSTAVCPNTHIFDEPLPVSRPKKMSLLEEARKVAAEFEYPPEEVNKGVKEFIRQMSSYTLWSTGSKC